MHEFRIRDSFAKHQRMKLPESQLLEVVIAVRSIDYQKTFLVWRRLSCSGLEALTGIIYASLHSIFGIHVW